MDYRARESIRGLGELLDWDKKRSWRELGLDSLNDLVQLDAGFGLEAEADTDAFCVSA
jgi:hypothetical protein